MTTFSMHLPPPDPFDEPDGPGSPSPDPADDDDQPVPPDTGEAPVREPDPPGRPMRAHARLG